MDAVGTPGFSVYAAALGRRRGLMLAVGAPIALGGLLLALAMPSAYLAPAKFHFEAPAIAQKHLEPHDANNYVDELVSRLKAAVLTKENLSDLSKALGNYPDNDATKPGAIDKIADKVKIALVTERILDPESGRLKDVNTGFTVAFKARVPEEAQKASEWLANRLTAISREMRRSKELQTAAFLGSESERYRGQIVALESKVADFKSKHYEELPESAQMNVQSRERSQQDANTIDQEIRALEQNRTFLQMQLQQALASGGNNETLAQLEDEYRHKLTTYDRNHPDMLALRKRIEAAHRIGTTSADTTLGAQLETQKSILAEARQRYSPEHPDVKRLEREIASLEARIAAGERSSSPPVSMNPVVVQLQTQVRGTDNQMVALRARKADVLGKLGQIERHLGSSPQVEKDYEVLMRDLTSARNKYDELLKQKMDAEITAAASLAGSGDEFRLVGAPSSQALEPAKPTRSAIGLIGVILAALLASIAAVGAEATDQTVRGTRDVVSLLGVTPVAIVPEIRNSVFGARRARRTARVIVGLIVGLPVVYFAMYFAVR